MKPILSYMGAALLSACILAPTQGFANSCPDMRSPLVTTDVKVVKVFEQYNAYYVTIFNGVEEKTVQIDPTTSAAFRKSVGKNIEVKYWEVQYFDEHDGECTQSLDFDMVNDIEIPKG